MPTITERLLAPCQNEHTYDQDKDEAAEIIADLLAALREARYFMMAPAEDLLWGVIGRLDDAISKAEAA